MSTFARYNGLLIQDLDIKDVSSERRNPIIANVMAQLDYMEKRGSGLTRICNETKALEGYKDELKPVFTYKFGVFPPFKIINCKICS